MVLQMNKLEKGYLKLREGLELRRKARRVEDLAAALVEEGNKLIHEHEEETKKNLNLKVVK